jgi:hypothetical protein
MHLVILFILWFILVMWFGAWLDKTAPPSEPPKGWKPFWKRW